LARVNGLSYQDAAQRLGISLEAFMDHLLRDRFAVIRKLNQERGRARHGSNSLVTVFVSSFDQRVQFLDFCDPLVHIWIAGEHSLDKAPLIFAYLAISIGEQQNIFELLINIQTTPPCRYRGSCIYSISHHG
jgi:hypothetical protein